MTTKMQEREAMEKIKKIVMGLGEDSYIGTAMIGVWEIMEENIANDFAISAKDRMDEASRAARETEKRIVAISAEKDAEIRGLKAKNADLERDLSETKEDMACHMERAKEYRDALADTNTVCDEWEQGPDRRK